MFNLSGKETTEFSKIYEQTKLIRSTTEIFYQNIRMLHYMRTKYVTQEIYDDLYDGILADILHSTRAHSATSVTFALGHEERVSLGGVSPSSQVLLQRAPSGVCKDHEVILRIMSLPHHIKDSTTFLDLYVAYVGTYHFNSTKPRSDYEVEHRIVPEAPIPGILQNCFYLNFAQMLLLKSLAGSWRPYIPGNIGMQP